MHKSYMVIDCESPTGREFTYYERDNSSSNKNWWGGRAFGTQEEQSYKKLQHPIAPVEVTLDEPGLYAEYWEHPVPLMTRRLYSVLAGAGVDNLQVYDAVIHDPFTGEDRTDYVAWNLVGTISAADLEKTDVDPISGDRLLCRREGATDQIMVHKTVIDEIRSAGIETLSFLDWR